MREIKFRALGRTTNKWETLTIYDLANGETVSWIDIDIDTLTEFTGLKDKHGIEIYEGDFIVDKEERKHVYWSDGAASWFVMNNRPKVKGGKPTIDSLTVKQAKRSEVIGDIHSNPKLIEQP